MIVKLLLKGSKSSEKHGNLRRVSYSQVEFYFLPSDADLQPLTASRREPRIADPLHELFLKTLAAKHFGSSVNAIPLERKSDKEYRFQLPARVTEQKLVGYLQKLTENGILLDVEQQRLVSTEMVDVMSKVSPPISSFVFSRLRKPR